MGSTNVTILTEQKFTHAIVKRAKEGDFRVQDDFGGTHHYDPTPGNTRQ